MPVDLGVFERQKSIVDQQQLQDAFELKKALAIQEAQKSAQTQELNAQLKLFQLQGQQEQRDIQRENLAAQKAYRQESMAFRQQQADAENEYRGARLANKPFPLVGTPTVDENGEFAIVPPMKLSATEQKEFARTQNEVQELEKAANAFEAIKEYQGKPMYSGFGANAITAANRVPGVGSLIDDEKASNTKAYQNLVMEGQFAKLQSTFPGSISNAERESLANLGALANFKPEEQAKILADSQAAITRNLEITRRRAREIATGEQYTNAARQSPLPPPPLGNPPVQRQQGASSFKEGDTATNPLTGQKLTYRNGQWQ
jgi:hypothetical protein